MRHGTTRRPSGATPAVEILAPTHCQCARLEGPARSAFRCAFCIDQILESKNEVVRENYALRAAMLDLARALRQSMVPGEVLPALEAAERLIVS